MCTTSMIGDGFKDWYHEKPYYVKTTYTETVDTSKIPATKGDIQELKNELELIKSLLLKALQYDKENGEPDCKMDEKVALLKALAETLQVDLSAIFPE